MAEPVSPQDAAAFIERAAAAATGGQQQQQAPQQPKAGQPQQNTNVGNAESQGAPATEGTKMAQDAIVFEVPIGENQTRKMTPQQIKSVLDRYSALNYQHAQAKPLLDVANAYLRANPHTNPQQLALRLLDMARAEQSNPQMGAGVQRQDQQRARSAPNDPDALKKWAEENAVSLPPGYEHMLQSQQQTQAQMQQMMMAMQRMMAQTQGITQAAAMANRQVQGDRNEVIRNQIGMNIDRVQQALQIPGEAADDFMMFASERGYTLEDFIDPNLTAKVMTDFKRAMSGPEMEQIRQVAQRRQAYTSAGLGSMPGQGGNAQGQQGESPLDRLAQSALEKKMGI